MGGLWWRLVLKVSVIIPTYNKATLLGRVLESIRAKNTASDYEIVVTDDGSDDDTRKVCEFYDCEYDYLDRPYPCGPAAAKNNAYRRATGSVFLCQNDDALHESSGVIESMCQIPPRTYRVPGTIVGLDKSGVPFDRRIDSELPRTTPMIGVRKADMYAIGGEDEDFVRLNCDDDWVLYRLVNGRGLRHSVAHDVVTHSLWHERPSEHWVDHLQDNARILHTKVRRATLSGEWVASGGAWS